VNLSIATKYVETYDSFITPNAIVTVTMKVREAILVEFLLLAIILFSNLQS
jgi:hypothetical protein